MSAQLHAAAVLALLGASGSPALTVYDGKVPDTDPPKLPPYLVVHFSGRYLGAADDPTGSDLTFKSRRFEGTATVHSVATTPAGARALANRASVALLDVVPTVTGRSCGQMKHIDDYATAPDEQTGTDYFDLVDVYRIVSFPG